MKLLITLTVFCVVSAVASDISGRITNGEFAIAKQFPYQVGLVIYFSHGSTWCGGTLISNRWILTAAHCISIATGVDVYLGTTNRTDRKEEGQQVIYVGKKNIFIHKNWNDQTIANDIALIKMPVAIEFTDYIQSARLPKKSVVNNTSAGEKAIASGWGRFSEALDISNELRWIEAPIITNIDCAKYYDDQININIDQSKICISTVGKKSTCNCDSGGPLILADGRMTLIGITSFGHVDCENEFPAVFTRTDYYLDWIKEITGIYNPISEDDSSHFK